MGTSAAHDGSRFLRFGGSREFLDALANLHVFQNIEGAVGCLVLVQNLDRAIAEEVSELQRKKIYISMCSLPT